MVIFYQIYQMLKKVATSLLWLISLPWCIYTLLAYLLGYTIVWEHWIAGFIMLSIPLAQLGCLVLFVAWLCIRPTRSVLPLVILLVGWPFVLRTLQYSPLKPYPKHRKASELKVFSYNVCGFSIPQDLENIEKRTKLVDYVTNFDADIKCFQEFSAVWLPSNKNAYEIVASKNGYRAFDTQGSIYNSKLVIFSKYPIIKQKVKIWPDYGQSNGYLYADIVLPNDTIRVINVQLQSMGIRVGRVARAIDDYNKAQDESKDILRSLKRGFIAHAEEIKEIERLIDESPYPTLVCGDLNEMPYGLVYGHISDRLYNAFEEAGNGLGFTLNRSPRWVRIDNQFFSEEFDIKGFKTHHFDLSDHFPISAIYELKSKKKGL